MKRKLLIIGLILVILLTGVLIYKRDHIKIDNTRVIKKDNYNSKNPNKVLILYFSKTGNTKSLANTIHKELRSEIYEIQTKDKYPKDINKLMDQAKKEQEDKARPKLKKLSIDINEYDFIFIGYPIWYGDMPMAMYSFLENNTFDGKMIIPFNTHEGSGNAGTFDTISKLQTNSTVLEGLSINYKTDKNIEDKVSKWIDNLGLAR